MCCGDSRPVSPQATMFYSKNTICQKNLSKKTTCRETPVVETPVVETTARQEDMMISTGEYFRKQGRLRRHKAAVAATHVLLACPLGMSSWHVPQAGDHKGRPYTPRVVPMLTIHRSPFTIHHSPFTITASYIAEVAETDAARNPRIIFACETRCRRFRETGMRPPGLFSLTYRHRRTLRRPVGLLLQPCFSSLPVIGLTPGKHPFRSRIIPYYRP